MFPEPGKNDVISCHALTPDFLILGTDMGGVSYFFLEDWVTVQEFKHGVGIKEIHPEPNGTKVILVDVKGQGHVYNPVNDEIALIRDFPDKVRGKKVPKGVRNVNTVDIGYMAGGGTSKNRPYNRLGLISDRHITDMHCANKISTLQMLKLLWDQSPADKDVFVAFDGNDTLHTFLVNPDGNEGISCAKLGQTKVGAGQVPALLLSGEVTLQTSGGKLVKMTLSTHEISPNISGT